MKILYDILNNTRERSTLIKEFQEYVWNNNPKFENPQAGNIMLDLAYDLDFYEPNEKLRREDPIFYGDEKLEQEIKIVIAKLQELK